MVRSGRDYLVGLRDGRHVQLGSEVVSDITTHPAFRNAAFSISRLYDVVHQNLDAYGYTENDGGEVYSAIWLRPKTAADLGRRRRVSEAMANVTYGLMGRSPDHVAGFLTGMACEPEVGNRHGQGFGANVVKYWEYVRDHDLYVSYAVAPPGRARPLEVTRPVAGLPPAVTEPMKTSALRVVSETDAGVTVWGSKILATAAVLSDELFIGNLLPMSPGEENFAVTFAIPIATPGLKLLPRKSYELASPVALDGPLASRFDETDAVVFFDNVFVPWERVFNHGHIDTALALFHDTPAHVLGNAQAHTRLLSKMRLALGLIHRISQLTGTASIPAVKEELAGLAMQIAVAESLIVAEDALPHQWSSGYLSPNLEALYAMSGWSAEAVPGFLHSVRYLLGSQPFQLAADASIFDDDAAATVLLQALGATSIDEARHRYTLMGLAWDLVGSEFASRHLQYEMFYAGARHVTRARMSQVFDWGRVDAEADRSVSEFQNWMDSQKSSPVTVAAHG
jgi:4-hydroxyphenylacetate 3-monooxygenase